MSGLSFHSPVLSPSSLTTTADTILARVLRRNPIIINLDPKVIYSPNRLSLIESRIGVATLILSQGHLPSHHSISGNWQAAKDYPDYACNKRKQKSMMNLNLPLHGAKIAIARSCMDVRGCYMFFFICATPTTPTPGSSEKSSKANWRPSSLILC